MNAYVKAFRRHLEIGHYSPSTVKSYLSHFRACHRYLGGHPRDWTVEKLQRFLHYLVKKRGYSASSINQCFNALKFLFERVLGKEWPVEKFVRPRKKKRLPVILSEQEVWKMINSVQNIKHRAVLELFYTSGIRMRELLNLRIRDIDSDRMQIRVHQGKGGKDRYTILSGHTLKLLRNYWRAYRPITWLFESYIPGKPYSATSVQKIFKRAKTKAGIIKPATVHTLRHCFATHMLEKGVPCT